MNDDDFIKLRKQLPELRKKNTDSKLGTVSGSIAYLMGLLDTVGRKKEQALIYSELVSECILSKREDLFLHFLKEQCHAFPDDPMIHCTLAHALAAPAPRISQEQSSEAIALGKAALLKAREQNRLVRYCGASLARIALIVDDYEVLHFAVSTLLADSAKKREEDTDYEFDFIEQIDPKRFDSVLLEQYRGLRNKL